MKTPQTGNTVSSAPCPDCGRVGRAVSGFTLESLVTGEARARLARTDGWRFCPTAHCPVIYHQPASGLRLGFGSVRVPVFQKSTAPDRPVCYCFHHTVAEIESQVRATGWSTVPADIKARCAHGLDACERNNPQGSCCLGNVARVVKDAQVRRAPRGAVAASGGFPEHDRSRVIMSAPPRARGHWAAFGALGAGVLSSACCWLPLLLLAFGTSAGSMAGLFERHRPWLLGAAALLLALGFHFVYFRAAHCAPGSVCAVPDPRLRRFNRLLLWGAAALTLGFALFPNYAGWLLRRGQTPTFVTAGNVVTRTFRVEGMTCAACAAGLEAYLRSLPGVSAALVDYARGEARIDIVPGADAGSVIESVRQTAGARGYRAEPVP